MELKPLHDRVLVQRTEKEEMTKGGILIPESAKEKPLEGIVVAVGGGKIKDDGTKTKLTVQKDDRILFSKYAGTEVSAMGEDYLIMRESDILAIIEK